MGACDSTVERTEDGNHFLITKILEYGGDNSGILVGPRIFLDDASTVTIKVCCKFLATHTAGSDNISIEAGAAAEGKLETEGSWQDSLTVWARNNCNNLLTFHFHCFLKNAISGAQEFKNIFLLFFKDIQRMTNNSLKFQKKIGPVLKKSISTIFDAGQSLGMGNKFTCIS